VNPKFGKSLGLLPWHGCSKSNRFVFLGLIKSIDSENNLVNMLVFFFFISLDFQKDFQNVIPIRLELSSYLVC